MQLPWSSRAFCRDQIEAMKAARAKNSYFPWQSYRFKQQQPIALRITSIATSALFLVYSKQPGRLLRRANLHRPLLFLGNSANIAILVKVQPSTSSSPAKRPNQSPTSFHNKTRPEKAVSIIRLGTQRQRRQVKAKNFNRHAMILDLIVRIIKLPNKASTLWPQLATTKGTSFHSSVRHSAPAKA